MKLNKLIIFPLLVLPLFCTSIKDSKQKIKVLATTEHYDVFMDDVIDVEPRILEYNDESKVVNGQIITPSGNTYEGHSFVVEEAGLYKVIYKAYFGFHEEIQEIEYLCKRKSADFFDITNPVEVSYGDYRHNTNKYHHEGLLIDVKNGTEIKFNMPLSTDDFLTEQNIDEGKNFRDRSMGAQAKPLIDFLIDPATFMERDFDTLTLRLTDSVDKSNYVDILIHDAYYAADRRSGGVSYVRVGASCNWAMGWEWNANRFHVGSSGTGLNLSFRGQPYDDNPLDSAQILYCSKNQRFYNYRGSLEIDTSYFVNDLADPIYYGNNTWNGFESGKFYMSIIPSSFTNATGRLLIKSVGKYLLNSEILTDDEAPTINVDTIGYDIYSLPHPVVGKAYPVFSSEVHDNYDSNLEAKVSVSYRDTTNNKDIDVPISDNKFLANKSGTYKIKYEAQDRSGNVSNVITLNATTVNSVDDIVLHLANTETTIGSYSEVVLPTASDVTATGGTGSVSIERKLYDPKGNRISLSGNTFKPTMVGDYMLKFKGTDYIGNSSQLIYRIHSLALTTPVFIDEVNLPPVLINGFKYSFSNVRAVETVNGENVILTPTIKVNNADYSGSVTASGSSMKIDFIAAGQTNTSTITRNLDVLTVKDGEGKIDQAKYFYGDLTATQNKDDITLEKNGDGEVTFANRLNPEDFYIGMRLISGFNTAELIRFKLVDVNDKNKSITFTLDLNRKKLQAPYLPELDYTLFEDQFGVYYNDRTFVFKDTNQNEIGSIIKDDNGNPFDGFAKGFYLTIALVNVTGTAKYKVERIGNQVMGYKNTNDDRIKPTIKYNSYLPSEQFKGKTFDYPTFEAFDVLSDITNTSIEIKLDGRTLVKGDQYCTTSFTIEKSGYYSLIYIAKDSSNNQLRITNSVSVYDDALPSLSVTPLSKTSWSVGEKMSIPSYQASDDSGAYTVDVILIMPTNEMRILLHHVHDEYADPVDKIEYMLDNEKHVYNASFIVDKTTFNLETAGSYRLRVVAYDSAFNSRVVEQSFEVK